LKNKADCHDTPAAFILERCETGIEQGDLDGMQNRTESQELQLQLRTLPAEGELLRLPELSSIQPRAARLLFSP
jgi:hypothetical protein